MENLPLDSLAIIIVIFTISSLIYFSIRTWRTNSLFQQGINFYQTKDYQNAEKYFRQVIAINSTNDVVHLLLGDTLMQQQQVEAAISKYEEVINRAPKKIDAHLRLANALLLQNQQKEAIDILKQAEDYFQSKRYVNELARLKEILQKIESQFN
ncbi:tetratricopeptide repeat protein [Calothrix rhizosoleniae]|uniref:tetratricopeptide repeat protein n=1 Tax=Calothrix rhizosoleniae TaxID=888997 RepID=UPI00190EFAB6|nr:tetratricopeptide repeat protein [Calothrix rhizosoleniae]